MSTRILTATRDAAEPDSRSVARSFVWHGALLLLLGLLSGFTVGIAEAPRGALGAHSIGLLEGTMLIALAGAWHLLDASARVLSIIKYTLLVGFYANWLGAQLGALWSAARFMYIPEHAERMPAGATPWMDGIVAGLFILSMVVLLSSLLMMWASRRHAGG